MAALQIPFEVNAIMEMQQFFPSDSFDCDEDMFGFDACVLQAVQDSDPPCILPFQNWTLHADMRNRMCQTHPEGYTSFQHFQRTSDTCKVPCTQLNNDYNYFMPQYLRAMYLPYVQHNEVKVFGYYLYLPSAVKVSRASPSYGFITFIAEMAGWYNLFLGGSIFAMWEVLGAEMVLTAIAKSQGKIAQVLSQWRNSLYILVSSAILLYIFIDCITLLFLNPVGSSTLLTNFIAQGLSLSICLPQHTSSIDKSFTKVDVANSTAFWVNGNNLSSKIFEISATMQDGTVLSIWNRNQSLAVKERTPFSIFNIVSSTQSVDFCHTVDLSTVSEILGVQIKAVNDIYLAVHLPGQLLVAQTKYSVANRDTMQVIPKKIFLYNSEVKIELEETSFQNVSTQSCKNYNTTWTYDRCVMDFGIMQLEGNTELLMNLLLPNSNSTVQQGIERTVLQRMYSTVQSQNECLPDCRSLVVKMSVETSPNRAQPTRGISQTIEKLPLPLPPLFVDINITLPHLSKLNQVCNCCHVPKIIYLRWKCHEI